VRECVVALKLKVTASIKLESEARWGATGDELIVRRMTNLFRREAVASLLMDGEAWKQPLALRRLAKRPTGSTRG
jgi:hypothetical protein